MTTFSNFDFLDSIAKDTNTKLDPTNPSLSLPDKFRFEPTVAPGLTFKIFEVFKTQTFLFTYIF